MSTTERTSVPADDSAAVVERLAGGDRAALAELYDRFARPVHSLARFLCGDDDLAADVTCAVFLAARRRAPGFDPAGGSVETWLLTLTHRHAVDAARGSHSGTDPAAVHALAPGLSRNQAEILGLVHLGGLTRAQVADRLGLPPDVVASCLLAAVTRLRDRS